MISGLSRPINSFGGLAPYEMFTEAINGTTIPLGIGDLVAFDLCAKSTVYTVAADLLKPNSSRSGFNVVTTTFTDAGFVLLNGGIFGIVMRGGAVGEYVKVCVRGIVKARLVTFKQPSQAVTNFVKGQNVFYTTVSANIANFPDARIDFNGDNLASVEEIKALSCVDATTSFSASTGFPALGTLLDAVTLPSTPSDGLGTRSYQNFVTVLFDGLVTGSNRG